MTQQFHFISDLDYGGAQSQLLLLAQSALERGDRVTVASLRRPGPVGRLLSDLGAQVVWLKQRFLVDPFVYRQLARLLRNERPDVLQTWDIQAAQYTRMVSPECRWLHTLRESIEASGWSHVALERVLKAASALVVPDPQIRTQLFNLGVQEAKVWVVPNAVGQAKSAENRIDSQAWLRAELGLQPEVGPLIGLVSRLDRPDEAKELAWAADLVRVLHPHAKLLLVGQGKGLMSVQRFARQAAAPGLVRCLGTRNDWGRILSGLDGLWCATTGSAAPTPVLEAMASGVPVVAARTERRDQEDEPDSLIKEGETSWITLWNDRAGWTRATEQILTNQEKAIAITELAKERVSLAHSVECASQCHQLALVG